MTPPAATGAAHLRDGDGVERSASTLGALAATLRSTSRNAPHIATQDFVSCCDTILPFFDHLGPVFHVARGEFQGKLDTLKQQAESRPQLRDVVDADKQANVATVKNSATRNLHRLAAAILFVKILFQRLLHDKLSAAAAGQQQEQDAAGAPGAAVVTLREAAGAAYEEALAPIHTTIIRGVVRAGMLTLPSREQFMQSIGETEDSAVAHAQEVVAACESVHGGVMALFAGLEMPTSSTWFWPA